MCRIIFYILFFGFLPTVGFGQNATSFSSIEAGMVDEWLVQEALKIANQHAVDTRCPEEYTKGVIISNKWQLEYTKDGFVKGRVIHMDLYCEREGDRCGVVHFTFRQKHEIDGAFTRRIFFVKAGKTYNVPCE